MGTKSFLGRYGFLVLFWNVTAGVILRVMREHGVIFFNGLNGWLPSKTGVLIERPD